MVWGVFAWYRIVSGQNLREIEENALHGLNKLVIL